MYNKSKPKKMLQEQRLGNEKGWREGKRERKKRGVVTCRREGKWEERRVDEPEKGEVLTS